MKTNHNTVAVNKLIKKNLQSKIKTSVQPKNVSEVLVISTYPPKECGIATYTEDLINTLQNKFGKSFEIKICALDSDSEKQKYKDNVSYFLDINVPNSFSKLADKINNNDSIHIVLVQHEFGLFKNKEQELIQFLKQLNKSILVIFHTVLPKPNALLQQNVQQIANVSDGIVVMTNSSSSILENDYQVAKKKISVIPHGTHLVNHTDKEKLKKKYDLDGKKVLSTFGLLGSGKSIETTLDALPSIIQNNSNVKFLIIGKTHPSVVKHEGERYREMLEAKIEDLNLQEYVQFINEYLPLNLLLEYLQLTDIYLFTSKDQNQAVSGTFSYAISCGCAIISTPIPHALEILKDGSGIIMDFENSPQLAQKVNEVVNDEQLMKNISFNGLHKMIPTAWENSAVAHAKLFENITDNTISLKYKIPEINLNHVKKMTNSFGMIQFSIINQPDIDSGFTLDDNSRALIAMCQYYELTKDESALNYIKIYQNFITYCFRSKGYFLNYIDKNKEFTDQNYYINHEDSNGRALWALGFLISLRSILPNELIVNAENVMNVAMKNTSKMHSTRAMAFAIKGIYYKNINHNSYENILLMKQLSDRLVEMYRHESDKGWQWFESYLTYANSTLPEALLCAYLSTGKIIYKEIAKTSFDFLLTILFNTNHINVISNNGWLHSWEKIIPIKKGGEQPIDVAYTILALMKFYDVFKEKQYLDKINIAFNWFLGNNHLNQIMYNPCTGGCYDGLEDSYINLNQGAESTLNYLIARLTIEKELRKKKNIKKAATNYMI